MNIGIIGLGRMGLGFAHRLTKNSHTVFGYDPSEQAQHAAHAEQVRVVTSIADIAAQCSTIFLLVPAGTLIDQILVLLMPLCSPETIIIDAGNSKFTDSIERAKTVHKNNLFFIDCGTSGGVHGKEQGYSLMIGGEKNIYEKLLPLWRALAARDGFGYVGKSGSGHFVKMVHNGIEYGLMQAYGEGFELLHNGPFKELDLAEISRIWQNGSIIRSWLLQLSHEILKKDQLLEKVSGKVAESGMGKWTVQTAQQLNVSVPVIKVSLEVRAQSRKSGGSFATKMVALLRNAFGGHEYERK